MKLTKILLLLSLFISATAYSASMTPFPEGWKSWTKVRTPLATIGGAVPSCSTDLSKLKLPPIYVKTVETYCGVKKDGAGKIDIYIKPSEMESFKSRSGKFSEGTVMIMHLVDLKVLFVTGYKGGNPVYGVYTEDKKDVEGSSPGLSTNDCIQCHTGFKSFCINGLCGRIAK